MTNENANLRICNVCALAQTKVTGLFADFTVHHANKITVENRNWTRSDGKAYSSKLIRINVSGGGQIELCIFSDLPLTIKETKAENVKALTPSEVVKT
jgi:hypothetical protein